jgi:YVTN family beta-propeller protein
VQTERVAWKLPFETGVLTMAIDGSADSTRRIFVNLSGLRGFAVVDFATHKEVARTRFPEKPSGFMKKDFNNNPTHGIAEAPDGTTICLPSRGSNAVFVYSLPDLKLLGSVDTPQAKVSEPPAAGGEPLSAAAGDPHWSTFTPDSKRLYVTNALLDSVGAIDVKTLKLVATIPVGKAPKRIYTLVLP